MGIQEVKRLRKQLQKLGLEDAERHAKIMGWAVLPSEVRSLRSALKLSQGRFAELVGVRLMTVWRWEHGYIQVGNKKLRDMIAGERKALTA